MAPKSSEQQKTMPENMTIAFICPIGLSAVLFCQELIRFLTKCPGSRVVVICDAGEYREQIEALGCKCISVPMNRWFNLKEDILYILRLWMIFHKEDFRAVFTFATKPNIYGPLVARLSGTSLCFSHVVGLGSGFSKPTSIYEKIVRFFFIHLYRWACSNTAKIWFTNPHDKYFFVANEFIREEQAVLTPNYLSVKEYALESVGAERLESARRDCRVEIDDQVVIMVARMIWEKGIREFAEAAERLYRRYPKVKFILVAPLEPKSRDAVPESYIRSKEGNSNLLWLGFQSDVKRLYAISDIAVLPTYYREGGYPRGLLEPMAMGIPVIASNSDHCCGTVENGRNGLLVPVRDSIALADAIERLLIDSELRKAMGKYSKIKAARDFDESVIVPYALSSMGFPIQTHCP